MFYRVSNNINIASFPIQYFDINKAPLKPPSESRDTDNVIYKNKDFWMDL